MEFNFLAIALAAVSALVVGFIWYNPKVFGTIWMNEIGMTEEKAKQGNMAKIFGLTFVFALIFAFMMPTITIHQIGALQLTGGNPNDEALIAFLQVHGEKYRSFHHGALHGFIAGLFLALPIVATNALFEQKSWKYILVTAGYWVVVMTVMGAIICGWK
jgi:hypothetical protein